MFLVISYSRIALQHGARVVSINARHIAAARNAGAAAAAGELLFFIDADTQLSPDALAQALAALDTDAIGGGGPIRFDPPVPRYVPIILPVVLLIFRTLRLTGGAFLFCTRAGFDAAGGWDESLFASEEIVMVRALKRHGRFIIVRAPVITSGRKLRTYSAGELLAALLHIGVRGQGAVHSRDHLDIWYAPRRPDPSSSEHKVAAASRPPPPPTL